MSVDERAARAALILALTHPDGPLVGLDRACEAAGLDPTLAEDRGRLIEAVQGLPTDDWAAAIAIATEGS